MAEETAVDTPAPVAKAAKSGSLITTIIIVLLSNAICVAAMWFFVQRALVPPDKQAAEGKAKETVDVAAQLEKSAVIPLEPFVVNLADSDAARYLRIKVSLLVDDKSKLKAIEENQALQLKMRDLILQTLGRKTSQDLTKEDGKDKLRHEIQEQLSPFFKAPKLNEVMFTEFVIQL